MGHALALGSLPKFMLQGHLEKVVSSLVKSTIITHETLKWAESRRDATKALCSVCVTMAEEIGKGRFIYLSVLWKSKYHYNFY